MFIFRAGDTDVSYFDEFVLCECLNSINVKAE